MPNSKRKCKYCLEYVREFIKLPAGVFCNMDHAIAYSIENKKAGEKKIRKESRDQTRKDKLRIKKRSEWVKDWQTVFNRYIRLRDSGKPCISCGRIHQGQMHAGHYRSVGANPELRFEELNCHAQCAPCNTHLSGNLINYRIGLIERIGETNVLWLEGRHDPKKYSIEEIKAGIKEYSEKCKQLQKEIHNNGN